MNCFVLFSLVLLITNVHSLVIQNTTSYWEARQKIIDKDLTNMIGHDIILTDTENQVNEVLLGTKIKEMMNGYNTSNVLSLKNFFLAKKEIEMSSVYNFIKKMPKGALLHSHDMALCPVEWIISELTYWPNLYICYLENDRMLLKFFTTPDSTCQWRNVQEERASYIELAKFDSLLKGHLSIITDNPDEDLPTLNETWLKFGKVFESLGSILGYVPAWRAYLVKVLETLVSDNVQYFEFRGVLFPLYDLEGSDYSFTQIVGIYEEIINNFTANNPDDFHGGRLIYAPVRMTTVDKVREYVRMAEVLRTEFPQFVAGFDLVGQEDMGKPLRDFIEPLLELQKSNVSIPTFFHAGETNWQGTDSDENMIDAILLNTTRIGHGYAITKHPYLMELLREKDIPVEICPVSNQVLKLVDDLRNHPMAGLVAQNFPLVIASDDPGLWGADPLTHDLYEAFFALGGARADLRFLKKLALNSIRYSSLDADRKAKLEDLWRLKWDSFLKEILTLENQEKDMKSAEKNSDVVIILEESNVIF